MTAIKMLLRQRDMDEQRNISVYSLKLFFIHLGSVVVIASRTNFFFWSSLCYIPSSLIKPFTSQMFPGGGHSWSAHISETIKFVIAEWPNRK